ncbi:MAG: AAA family ATPase [Thermoanaerobaculia bacterium]
MNQGNDPLQRALRLPRGARFYRCALQVNPFQYLLRYNKPTGYTDEDSYNRAIVQACRDHAIEVIGVTDHYGIRDSAGLIAAARQAGIVVFPGFEAVSKDGVHVLCLFDPERPVEELERVIGECGIHTSEEKSPSGDLDVTELLARAAKWHCVFVAAHVTSPGGLLRALTVQARVKAWKSEDLLACSQAGPAREAPEDLRQILLNKDPEYKRDRPVAVINAQDVNSPEDLAKPGTSCWIKMSKVWVEGLRQAFLDPESRIRLGTEPLPPEHLELVAMAWEGGFLDGQAVHFNENLNALIGGRGAGKSTLIESIRYVLDLEPLGNEAKKNHEGIVRDVLKSGTRVYLLVRSTRPSTREYRIERIVPNPSTVRDDLGKVLPYHPRDVLPGAEVYGQHEISELTKSRDKLTRLLDRFVRSDPGLSSRQAELERELARSRSQLLEVRTEIAEIDERLSRLPGLEETLKRYQDEGLEERLKERSLVVREERVLKTIAERASPFEGFLEQLRRGLPIDRAFLSSQALVDLPGKDILAQADKALAALESSLQKLAAQMEEALQRFSEELGGINRQWEERKRAVQKDYEKILRELQRSNVDGEDFIRLRKQIEDLRPLQERRIFLRRQLDEIVALRRNLTAEWEDLKSAQFRELEHAASRVNKTLRLHVRVTVSAAGNRDSLAQLIQELAGGRLTETKEAVRQRSNLSVQELASALRAGSEAVQRMLKIPPSQADRLAAACPEIALRIEELNLPATTRIELNVGTEDDPAWQELEDLSTGQKATAVLLLLLLESDAPLVVDQPEDDLDNRFITEVVVPKMREEKRRRQFIFSTHNANIPVLGDAELIVGLQPAQGQAELPVEQMGSMDSDPVRSLVEEILEGGQRAFELRRLKYGF